MIYDLHTHSTASDGILSPTELIHRAIDHKVNVLALTDHDTVSGIDDALKASKNSNLKLIPGIEISAKWEFFEIHVIGLNIDPANEKLLEGIQDQQQA